MAGKKDVVGQARADLAKLEEQHAQVLAGIDAKKVELGTARGLLGKRVLTGEGSLTELSGQLKQTEDELNALEMVRAESERLLQDARGAVQVARREQAIQTISEAYNEFEKVNSSAEDLLAGVYSRLEALEEISGQASWSFNDSLDAFRYDQKQANEVKVNAIRRTVKEIRGRTEALKVALGG